MQIKNISGKNEFGEKIAHNSDEVYKELIKLKTENEELKKKWKKDLKLR